MSRKMRARIEELERLVHEKDLEISNLKDQVAGRELQFEKMQQIIDNPDPECKPGPYCKACVHAKLFTMRTVFGLAESVYLCNKNGGCKNFVSKEKSTE